MLNVSFVFVGYENGRPYWESTQYGMRILWNGLYWEIINWPYDGLPVNYTDTDIPLTGWQLIGNTTMTANFNVNLGECCFEYSYLNDVLDSTLTIKYIDCNYNSQNITAEYGESGSFCAVSIEFSNNTGSYSLTGDLCPPEPSITPSISITPSTTPSITPSITPNISISVTPSITPSVTPSISISVTPSTTPSITPSITPSPSSSNLFEALISTTSDPSDACSLSLVDTVWIEGNFNRVFTDAGGAIPFNGGNAYWHMQKLTDVVSRSQDIDTNGYPINPAALCP
jgi:hypothetical protein